MCLKCPNESATIVAEKPAGRVRSALGADALPVSEGIFLSLLLQADKTNTEIMAARQAKRVFVFINLSNDFFSIVINAGFARTIKQQAKLIKKLSLGREN
jgi:hypothetical protein